jgi:hypothetical protein
MPPCPPFKALASGLLQKTEMVTPSKPVQPLGTHAEPVQPLTTSQPAQPLEPKPPTHYLWRITRYNKVQRTAGPQPQKLTTCHNAHKHTTELTRATLQIATPQHCHGHEPQPAATLPTWRTTHVQCQSLDNKPPQTHKPLDNTQYNNLHQQQYSSTSNLTMNIILMRIKVLRTLFPSTLKHMEHTSLRLRTELNIFREGREM